MFSLSRERFMKYLLTGGFIGFAYSFLSHARTLPLKLVDSLFVAGMFPLLYGGCLVAKNLGMFHLFVYSHRKLWKYGKRQEKKRQKMKRPLPAPRKSSAPILNIWQSQSPPASQSRCSRAESGWRSPLF